LACDCHFDLAFEFGQRKLGEQRVGLPENLAEAWAEKRRMEAAASENNKIVVARFPKLGQSLRKEVEDDISEYNHHYGSSGQVAFFSPSAQTFAAKRAPNGDLHLSYNGEYIDENDASNLLLFRHLKP
jgi:hypothetical protein